MSSSILVFLVEDYELIRQLLAAALEDDGFDVAMAATGEQAMDMLDAKEANFSALITDVNLPGEISGWDVARHAREIDDKLPVIYMTGASAHDWDSKGVPNSVLMLKPFAPGQLIAAVSRLLTGTGKIA